MSADKNNFLISYDFIQGDMKDEDYRSLQSKVSSYMKDTLGEQIMHNVWYKHWTSLEKNSFIKSCESELTVMISKNVFDRNFKLLVCQFFDCWSKPEHIRTKVIGRNICS